jgi:3-oxoadipate enol-lactonase
MWNTRLPDYSVAGSSDTTVYILHGLYGGKEYWQPLSARLVNDGYRVVAWDAPGYGISPPDPDFNHANAAAACARLVAKTGTQKNIIFGHSMGGSIALRVNPLIPGLINGFVMCASLGYIGNQSASQKEEFFRSRQTDATDTQEIRRKSLDMVGAMMAPGASGDYVELVKRVGATTPPHAVKASLKAIGESNEKDAMTALAAIRYPSLFIAGELDKTAHAASIKTNADKVPGSQFEVIAGAGHYPWAEKQDEFWSKLAPFLARCVDGGKAASRR